MPLITCIKQFKTESRFRHPKVLGGVVLSGVDIGTFAKEKNNMSENNQVTVFTPTAPISQADLQGLQERRGLLKQFISSQMRENIDFGVIPGVKSPSLFKPGAEKLAQLFGYGCRMTLIDKTVDLHMNFAMFTYQAEIYHLRSGTVVAQLEGNCNSQEKKFKDRTDYKTNAKEATPIADVLNTLMKMAQKRAYVGAVIQATGASDFYTQDIDDPRDALQNNITPPVEKTKAAAPKVNSTQSTDASENPELCCGQAMLKSKFKENTVWCTRCKATKEVA